MQCNERRGVVQFILDSVIWSFVLNVNHFCFAVMKGKTQKKSVSFAPFVSEHVCIEMLKL